MSILSTKQKMADEIGHKCPEDYNASRLLFENLDQGRGSNVAVYSDTGELTYDQLACEANRIGNTLQKFEIKQGERVLLFLDDEPAYPAAVMGAMKVGCVPILTNTLLTEEVIHYMLADSEAKAVIVSESLQELFGDTVLAGTACSMVIVAGKATGNRSGWEIVRESSADLKEVTTSKDDMSLWMYSSGTTGRPKGVVHRHEDLLYSNAAFAENILCLTPEDVCYSIPKIFFAYGFGNTIIFPFAAGAASVLATGRPEPSRIFDQIKKHQPTVLFGLPTVFNALIKNERAQVADLSSVRLCLSAAEVLSKDIFDSWRDRFGQEIIEGLGSTEMLHIYLSNTDTERKIGSAGKRVPGYAIRLLDASGMKVPDGEEGIMEVSGLSGTITYWNRPDKTSDTMRGEWLRTGDLFVRDSEGFYFFKGRVDDLVKVSGQWLWPHEIEMALAEHPEVKECAVLAEEMSDSRMTVVAYVVRESDKKNDDDFSLDLKNFVKKSLLPHKYPRKIYYLDELPKTGTQKVDRQALKSISV